MKQISAVILIVDDLQNFVNKYDDMQKEGSPFYLTIKNRESCTERELEILSETLRYRDKILSDYNINNLMNDLRTNLYSPIWRRLKICKLDARAFARAILARQRIGDTPLWYQTDDWRRDPNSGVNLSILFQLSFIKIQVTKPTISEIYAGAN
ncbi:13228_t:CDS:2 [Funneliformis geosporum]|uniref:7345_t:CDS:1 n=1 Tax=Funneliformis geosporum TaxID=1117311 RepID=A0A9W4SP25_9GLOM|nr:7345_t:CDS:2 [Funneliformis geosporum]CAI2179081.1 13228_t:CDS:2 [Funneliformis geosporum]